MAGVKGRGRLIAACVSGALVIVLGFGWVLPRLDALSLIARVSGVSGWLAHVAAWRSRPVSERILSIPIRSGSIRARLYQPNHQTRRSVVLATGIHPAGIDEPRLVGVARALAERGMAVLTPDLPGLARFEITPRSTDIIEDSATWLAAERELSTDGKVGLMGISFSGGLSVVAAGRPGLRDNVAFVFALGGHGDLTRVLKYLCSGREPDGHARSPHDYSLAVVLIGAAPDVVPAEQVEPLRRAIRTFLRASAMDDVHSPEAPAVFAAARKLEAALPEPSSTLMHFVNTRDVGSLGTRLSAHLETASGDSSLSPERSPAPLAPVFLLHGADDNVIPAIESRLLAKYLERTTQVRVLVSNLITHAETDRPWTRGEAWDLVGFWADLLSV